MSYIVSARKYRPLRFEDVVGQSHITSTISNAIRQDKLAHAFLFCGPRGVGKTTCARLLAKVINMPDPKAALEDGSYAESDMDLSMNIVELDGASNNSVEHMRTLIEQVRYAPQQGKYKIFIIDEVHMLSQAAFNAFLKTLEEPPSYAIFILATTEKHKILPTIMSRCQLYDFRRIQVPDIIAQLQKIAEEENVSVEYDALQTIAERADGAMRDALSIFDRLASGATGPLTYDEVVKQLNLLNRDYFFQAVDMTLREDAAGLLVLFNEVLRNGFEGDIFLNDLARHYRDLLYCKQANTVQLLQCSESLQKQYLNQADATSYNTILNALAVINEADINYVKSKDKRLHVEMALLRMCYAARVSTPTPAGIENTTAPTKKKIEAAPTTTKANTAALKSPPSSAARIESQPEEKKPLKATPTAVAQDNNKTQEKPPEPAIEDKSPATAEATTKKSSIDDLLSATREEMAAQTKEQKPLKLEDIKTLWQEYTAGLESMTAQAVLNTVDLSVDETHIICDVPTTIAKEEIQQETALYKKLRDYFNRPDLAIEIQVNKQKFPDVIQDAPRKLVNTKEKYAHLVQANPMLDQLIDRLGLQPDDN